MKNYCAMLWKQSLFIFSGMSMRGSQFSKFVQILGNTFWIFYHVTYQKLFVHIVCCDLSHIESILHFMHGIAVFYTMLHFLKSWPLKYYCKFFTFNYFGIAYCVFYFLLILLYIALNCGKIFLIISTINIILMILIYQIKSRGRHFRLLTMRSRVQFPTLTKF